MTGRRLANGGDGVVVLYEGVDILALIGIMFKYLELGSWIIVVAVVVFVVMAVILVVVLVAVVVIIVVVAVVLEVIVVDGGVVVVVLLLVVAVVGGGVVVLVVLYEGVVDFVDIVALVGIMSEHIEHGS